MNRYILKVQNITKEFPGVKALDDVSFKVKEGEIHAIIGENGAGKSTLINIIGGVYPYGSYDGKIIYNNDVCKFKTTKQSEEKGIAIIHQELMLIPDMSIAENIFLGNENSKAGIINWNKTISKSNELLEEVGLEEKSNNLITNISIGKQQLVEIAKALSLNVKLLILDEPTSALNETDSDNLLDLINKLKKQGMTCLYISHKLNEVLKIADSITILRDGMVIETMDTKKDTITEDRIVNGMVGRKIVDHYPKRDCEIGDVLFKVENWNAYHPIHTDRKIINNVSMEIKSGEVVGIAGLMGSGRTEFAMSVFGKSYGKRITGKVYKNNKEISTSSVSEAMKNGIAYISEDRKNLGLILIDNIMHNITLPNLDKVSRNLIINENEEIKVSTDAVERLKVKCTSILQTVQNLSGGNQQKVVLSKWIFRESDIIFMDEPTRGIDVGAKNELYGIINNLAAEGKAILFISSELPEVLGVCDRIYVMSAGEIRGELNRNEATQNKIMQLII